ncbi:MAG: N-acetylmuramoyl-L-alanine amidase [Micromonosporaceae bacterium]
MAAAAVMLSPSAAAASPDAGADTTGLTRQQAFAEAAAEYGVPDEVLLAVSYLESRWDAHAGEPSRGAGYGPMHLTDIASVTENPHHHHGDARGDESRPRSTPDTDAPSGKTPASLRTLRLATSLTDLSAAELRSDPTANIFGGAAVLADYQKRHSGAPGDWYGAVARYSGAGDTASAKQFADEVYKTMRTGAERVTDDGEHVTLPATKVAPDTGQLRDLGLRTTDTDGVECPAEIACESIPAPYQEYLNPDGTPNYGNHDKADRPNDLKIRYILIHDTETSYENTLRLVQNPKYVSWHYTLRSSDGHIAQHVPTRDVAWHAGNWYVNMHSIGLEHEGFAAQGTWYTEAMYRTSAKLVRYLADKYDVPLDRAHIIGHDNVPGITPARVPAMHWDTGPYWDWAHYFDLLGKPFEPTGTARSKMVTIKPDFATNKPAFVGCDAPGEPCPARSSTSVILRSEPRDDAPLLNDLGLRPDGSPNTMKVSDIGSRVDTGTQWALAEDRGEWLAIWYLGQKGWLHRSDTIWSTGLVVTPKPGKTSIPVYGRAYPEASAYPEGVPVQGIVPLQYSLPAGQRYTVGAFPTTDYYRAVTFDTSKHVVVSGKDRYYQIQFGHRFMYVRAADVRLMASPMS